MALSERRFRFVHEYRKDRNAAAAAIRAGYSKKGAAQQGHRVLRDVDVQMELAQERAEFKEKVDVSVEYVLAGLKEVADRTRAGRLESSGANKALELIGKHLGMFQDKLELSGGPRPISIKISGIR